MIFYINCNLKLNQYKIKDFQLITQNINKTQFQTTQQFLIYLLVKVEFTTLYQCYNIRLLVHNYTYIFGTY